MIETLRKWYDRHLTKTEAVILAVILTGFILLLALMGEVLTPVFIALRDVSIGR